MVESSHEAITGAWAWGTRAWMKAGCWKWRGGVERYQTCSYDKSSEWRLATKWGWNRIKQYLPSFWLGWLTMQSGTGNIGEDTFSFKNITLWDTQEFLKGFGFTYWSKKSGLKKNALGFEARWAFGELPHLRSGQKKMCSPSVLRKGCWGKGGIQEGLGSWEAQEKSVSARKNGQMVGKNNVN